MSFVQNGEVSYKAIFAPSVKNRSALDGSVPHTVGADGYCNFVNSAAQAERYQTVFVLAGQPAVSSVVFDSPETKTSLAKRCVANLQDVWFDLSGSEYFFEMHIAVCPPGSFPLNADNMYLYHGHYVISGVGGDLRHLRIDIPNIEGVIIPTDWNVCVLVDFYVMENGYGAMNFHSVCTLDD